MTPPDRPMAATFKGRPPGHRTRQTSQDRYRPVRRTRTARRDWNRRGPDSRRATRQLDLTPKRQPDDQLNRCPLLLRASAHHAWLFVYGTAVARAVSRSEIRLRARRMSVAPRLRVARYRAGRHATDRPGSQRRAVRPHG